MSSITQAKAEAQKLIKRYNKLQAEARTADSAAEAARKASEAEKLVSQISSLQAAISKLQAKDKEEREAVAKKIKGTATVNLNEQETKKVEEEKGLLESRIARIEDAQKRTRAQIDQLNRAKAELARLKTEAEQNVARERRASDERLQQEIAKLIKKKELEQNDLKQELDVIREQARKDADLLKAQRDAARAMMEKQQQLEREKLRAVRSRRAKKGLWISIIGALVGSIVIIILALVTSIFDKAPVIGPTVTTIKRSWATTPSQSETVSKISAPEPVVHKEEPAAREVEEVVEPLRASKRYQDPLKSGGSGPLMVKLPEGTFLMGAKDSSPYGDEKPQHKVSLQGFSISAYEITFSEYDVFANATGRAFPKDNSWGRGDRPVINVSYDDAVEYAKWLTEQSGYQYRLPSEREWEYAAAAGTKTDYWWGYKVGRNQANCGVCGSQWDGQQTAPVGSFQPNSAGLYDTIGNVMEWTSTCYRSSYQGAPSFGNNWEGGDCSKRIVRSSSFRSSESSLRTTKREKYSSGSRIDTLGFRVVRVD
ncbi:MAG: hypothetical protein BWK79_17080 [Beggiatoa sp. IS2]|nr:MAG: hypothetical protein BWK79_17080 [Beggiatoa sp. IS2]